MYRLILASASPRRHELLTQAGYSFTVHPAHIPEDPLPNEDPIAYVVRLAREKAEAVFREISANPEATSENENAEPVRPEWTSESCTPRGQVSGHDFSRADTGSFFLSSERASAREKAGSASFPAASEASKVLNGLIVLGADTTVVLDNQILGKPADAEDAKRMLRLLSGRTHRVITGVALATETGTEAAAEVTSVRFLTLSDEEIADYVATGEPVDKAGAYAIQGRAARWIPRVEGCYFNVVGLPLALVSTMLESMRPAS